MEVVDVWGLCDLVRETAYAVHVYFKHGHLERVYENALVNRLRKRGVQVVQQHSVVVYDEDGMVVGEYVPDLFVANSLVVELKAARSLGPEHYAQMLGYLRAARVEHGLLINFGARKFQVRKFALAAGRERRGGC